MTHRTTGQSWSTSGTSDSLSADWGGQASDGTPFAQGACDVVFSAHGLPDVSTAVWVAHQKDLRTADKNWLIVDDFTAATLSPNLGAWSSFDNSSKSGTATVSNFGVSGTGFNRGLFFNYDLGVDGFQYCGAEWDVGSWAGIAGVQKITYRAKSDHYPLIIDYYLLHQTSPTITITTFWILSARLGRPTPII